MLITTEVISVLAPIIVGLFTMIGVIYTARKTQDKNDAIQEEKINALRESFKQALDRIEEKISDLSVLQQKHNQIIERTYQLERSVGESGRDIKTLYNHVDEIKADMREVKNNVEDLGKNVAEIKESEIRLEGRMK